ncbi:MAG TPA: hypothetical protein VNL17_08945 [Verrucomicrobiae bacterium]|nr:hypothetical protein [Verrucomicrobiae bacterium]
MSTLPSRRPPELAWKWPTSSQNKETATPSVGHVVIQALVPAAVAGVFFLRNHRVAGWIVLALSGWMLVSGLLLPRAFLAVERALKAFGRLVALGLTWLLLVVFFFLFFLPLSLFLRRQMRALLALEFDKNQASYWQDRLPVSDAEHFQRQY